MSRRPQPAPTAVPDEPDLERLQWVTLSYYLRETNPANGLVTDKTQPGCPCSITAVGMMLAALPVAVERQILNRESAVWRTLQTLRFFRDSPQGPERDATGYKGFYYHFLDMRTGRRVWDCELSTVDTGFLLAGMLTAATYFDGESEAEAELRGIVDALYRRMDWQWAADGGPTLTHGWTPERGFLGYRWTGYDESLLLNLLALGSPTSPLAPESYPAWCASYCWQEVEGIEYLYSGPLFTHQLSHIWVDFRGIRDAYMRDRGVDYFENSRRASLVHQRYAIRNPMQFAGYGEHCWGITACNGPGPLSRKVRGIERRFWDYTARGAPFGPDDGTIAPWAAFASLPFAPEIVLPTIRTFEGMDLGPPDVHGYRPTFNQTFTVKGAGPGFWVSPDRFGLDQGPILLMIENYRTGFVWDLMKRCRPVVDGLRRAGFTGGWLD